jgi:D-3-phosphoglycerate dehydrogenase / 2-oxoglutarate reductase
MKIIVLDDYQDVVRHLDCFRTLHGHDAEVLTSRAAGLGQLAVRLRDAEAIVLTRERTRITDALLARLPKLRLISQTGKAGPHIDLDACSARGVAVAESTGYSAATAEFTWLLILAALRRLPAYMANLYAGQWQRSVPPAADWPLAGLGVALAGQTLGIWSYGKIGTLVAGYGKAFGMKVLVHGSAAARARAQHDGFETTERDALFERADVLSLHLRLADTTRGCVTPADFARMKRTALFVNTSRAELVEPGALLAALHSGRPGLAAVDVYEREPATLDEPLLRLANVIASPHLGFVERTAYETMFGGAFDNVVAFAAGRPQGTVNTAALSG